MGRAALLRRARARSLATAPAPLAAALSSPRCGPSARWPRALDESTGGWRPRAGEFRVATDARAAPGAGGTREATRMSASLIAGLRSGLRPLTPTRRCWPTGKKIGLLVHAGCPLPGLYERAAVLCSGHPPAQLDRHLLSYPDLPPEVASNLARALRELQGQLAVGAVDPAGLDAAIQEGYLRYYDTAFRLRDPSLMAERRHCWRRPGVILRAADRAGGAVLRAPSRFEVCADLGLADPGRRARSDGLPARRVVRAARPSGAGAPGLAAAAGAESATSS